MDPNAVSADQIIFRQASLQSSIGTKPFLKSLINLRINRKTFLLAIIFYQVVYFFTLRFFISWQNPLVDTVYFPLFYASFHMVLMLFYIWRLHDINKSGFWILVILIPRIVAHIPYLYMELLFPRMIIDWILIAFLLYKRGSETANDYSEKPKIFSSLF